MAEQLLEGFDYVTFRHVLREFNEEANEMAQVAAGVHIPKELLEKIINIKKRTLASLQERGIANEIFYLEVEESDWRYALIQYLKNPSMPSDRKTRLRGVNYILFDDELYKKSQDDLLLKCLGKHDAMLVMTEVHEGICGSHQAGIKIRWLIRRHGFYWPTILFDCIKYAKGCQPY